MSKSFQHFLVALAAVTCFALSSALAHGQAVASCTFKLFQLPTGTSFQANGVNDYSTLVGQVFPAAGSSAPAKAFIHYSGGSDSYFSAPNAATTSMLARNNSGVSVGFYSTQGSTSNISKGFILQGSTFTSFAHPNAVWGTQMAGINKYNSVVGWYLDSGEFAHGFKRYSNGGLATINYPSAQSTYAIGINDSGTIVGFYSNPDEHGFIYHNGQWATLDYPNTTGTELYGISNSGVIIGLDHSLEQGRAFLYENGTFKVIDVPDSYYTHALGISPGGIITGVARVNASNANNGVLDGFTAKCK